MSKSVPSSGRPQTRAHRGEALKKFVYMHSRGTRSIPFQYHDVVDSVLALVSENVDNFIFGQSLLLQFVEAASLSSPSTFVSADKWKR